MSTTDADADQSTAIAIHRPLSATTIAGLVVSLIAIGSALIGTPLWVVDRMRIESDEVKAEVVKAIESHEKQVHPGGVSREVYDAHVRRTDERHSEQKEAYERIERKLDALGERVYATERDWLRATDTK